ncbi:hypothetical protein [Novipirellula maiorica]|uniref:hypothetical protein n=1 Tax=Novipirellula maiorica TaxID=1265734 RepID=UPI001181AA18|nr:hypothetical protein [Rhodopirellula maiorica]
MYENALSQQRIDPTSRLAITKAFAEHAVKLSPLYSPSTQWNARPWIAALGAGWKADPSDLTLSIAYCQMLIDAGEMRRLATVTEQFQKSHPNSHEANAWAALASGKLTQGPLEFPLHFCVLTKSPVANRNATEAQCKREVEILNNTFRTSDGKQLVKFTFKSFTPYKAITGSDEEFLQYGDSTTSYNSNAMADAFNRCDDPAIRDRNAINVYIFDAYSHAEGFRDITSHGTRNSNRPYVLLDHARLNNAIQNAEAHEMGHAFGLGHVGVPNAKLSTSTNIMTSAAEEFGSGGKRDIGFSPAQSAIILYHAVRTHSRLGLD